MAQASSKIQQLLSAGAVVVSLLFVGFEIRQNTAAQRAETRQGLADGSRDLILAIASDQALSEAYMLYFPRPGNERTHRELTTADTIQVGILMYGVLRNAENVYLQYREGVVDESVLATYAFEDTRYRTEAFKTYWQQQAPFFDSAFVRAFEAANGID